MTQWQAITHALHRHGGGPLPRSAFDSEGEHEAAASTGLARAKVLGLVTVSRKGVVSAWALTERGRDWCEGRCILEAGEWRRVVETAEERQKRIARLVADAEDAAQACARLTKRQREVLVLSAKGFTCQEIADRLGIHYGSAGAHSTRMLAALGCTRSIEAAVIAAKAGIV